MKKILFVLCEGPHDAAFLYRILRVNGLQKYSKPIGKYPVPLNGYLAKEAAGENLEQIKLDEARNRLLPAEVLVYGDDALVLLYVIGGDSKEASRRTLIKNIASMYAVRRPEEKKIGTGATAECSVLYFFDADNKGVEVRFQEICNELTNATGEDVTLSEASPQYCHSNGIVYAAYIFAESGQQTGKLENILLPLLKRDNEEIFTQAERYVDLHDPERLPRLKIKVVDGQLTEIRDKGDKGKYCWDKSVIGVAAQLQNSGSTNTVCIKHSDYLNRDKIVNDLSCQKIWRTFRSMIDQKDY
ncbi:MAG: hypothetical protein K2L49_01990 [Muribaculaceae bacterium]|nr:hypothetical protein [Muribaculaceae bacterium]